MSNPTPATPATSTPATFSRAAVGASRVEDKPGRVRIYIARADAATTAKANITRSIVVDVATVGAVTAAIEAALFGGGE